MATFIEHTPGSHCHGHTYCDQNFIAKWEILGIFTVYMYIAK